jgi:murein DD-endopeptidase MepM/ murein hydrolase activator NlpD
MFLKWMKKKLTFVIIPDADKAIVRLRVPILLVVFIPAILASISTAVVILGMTSQTLYFSNSQLAASWDKEKISHQQTITSKNNEIAALQEEILQISQETATFAAKMEELRLLEQEILSFTDEQTSNTSVNAERPTASVKDNQTEPNLIRSSRVQVLSANGQLGGVGGEYIPISTDEALELSNSISTLLTDMDDEAERLKDSFSEAIKHAERIAYLRSITPSIYPTNSKRITSSFGYRRDPFTRRTARHLGVDFGGDKNDPIFATANGKISETGYDRAMGNYIIIKHGNGVETVYMHLTKSLVKRGQSVDKGEKIGLLGSTGRSTGPHLHYEVHKNGIPVNPKPYLQTRKDDD